MASKSISTILKSPETIEEFKEVFNSEGSIASCYNAEELAEALCDCIYLIEEAEVLEEVLGFKSGEEDASRMGFDEMGFLPVRVEPGLGAGEWGLSTGSDFRFNP